MAFDKDLPHGPSLMIIAAQNSPGFVDGQWAATNLLRQVFYFGSFKNVDL